MADDIERTGIRVDAEVGKALQDLGQFVHALQRIPGVMEKTGRSFDAASLKWDAASKRYKATTAEGRVQFISMADATAVFAERSIQSIGQVAEKMDKFVLSSDQASGGLDRLGKQSGAAKETLGEMGNVTEDLSKMAKQLGVDMDSSNEKIARSADSVVKANISHEASLRRLAKAAKDLEKPQKDREAAELRVKNAQDQVRVSAIRVAQTKRAYQRAVESASKTAESASKTTFSFSKNLGFLQVKADAVKTAVGVKATAAIKAFGVSIAGVSGPLLALIAVLGALAAGGFVAIKTLGLIKKAFRALLQPVRSAIEKMKRFTSRALSTATGILFRDALRSIINQIRELSRTALQTAVSFEALTVRMEVLIARFIRAEKLTKSYGDVMQEAAGRAQNMMRWIQQLAMTAPIDVEDIATVSSLAMAFGWTEDEAKTLTRTVSMFTAGMGLGSEHMQRIIFNFGQMKAAAKVTGTEIRDLVRGSFFPMIDVLEKAAETMGLTGQGMIELRELAATGEIPTDIFFKAFIDVVERDFPDALERMGRTMKGVMTRATSLFKTLVGYQVLGPIIDNISDSLAGFLDRLATDETLNKARMVGRAIVKSYDMLLWFINNNLIPAFRELATAIGLPALNIERLIFLIAWMGYGMSRAVRVISRVIVGIANKISTILGNIESGAYDWGFNIISTLASGMAAAVRFVINAINVVSRAIAKWLSPGSPPLALPKLPQWGANAMLEFLRGFALADFSVLSAIQRPVRDALAMFVDLGAITKEQMAKVYADLSKEVAKAVSTGIFEEDLFRRIAAQTGEFGEEISLLARKQIELAGAIREVEESERRLEEARKREERAGIKVTKLIREYNQELRKGADKNLLKLRLDQVNAAEQERLAAKDAKVEAEGQVDVAKEQLKIIEEIARAQQELVNQLIEITRMFIDAQQAASGTAEAVTEDLGGLFKFPDPEDVVPLPDIEAELSRIFGEAMKSVDAFFDEWEKKWNKFAKTYLDPLTEAFGNIGLAVTLAWKDHISPTLDSIEKGWGALKDSPTLVAVGGAFYNLYKFIADEAEWWSSEATRWWGEHGKSLEFIVNTTRNFIVSAFRGLRADLDNEEREWETLWEKMQRPIGAFANFVGQKLSELWELHMGQLANFMKSYGLMLDSLALLIQGDFKGALDALMSISELSWGEARDKTEEGGEEAAGAAYTAGTHITADFERGLEGLGSQLPDAMRMSGNNAWEEFKKSMSSIIKTAEETGDEVVSGFDRPFVDLQKTVESASGDIEKEFGLLRDRVVRRSIVPEMMDDINFVVKTGLNDTLMIVTNGVNDIIDKFTSFAKDARSSWEKFWSETVPNAIIDGTKDALSAVGNLIIKIFEMFADTDWGLLGQSIISGLTSALSDGVKGVVDTAGQAGKSIVDVVKDAIGMGSPAKEFINIGENITSAWRIGIEKGQKRLIDQVQSITADMIGKSMLIQARLVAQPVSTARGEAINVHMGGVAIHNQMDQATFEARVTGVLRKLIR